MLKLRAIIMSLAMIIPFAANATDMESVLEVEEIIQINQLYHKIRSTTQKSKQTKL